MNKAIICSLTILAALFFIPKIAYSGYVGKQVEKELASALGGEVSIGKMHLGWLGPQKCENLTWARADRGVYIKASSVEIPGNLVDCIILKKTKASIRNLKVQGAQILLKGDHRLLKSKGKQGARIDLAPFDAHIEKGKISFESLDLCINNKLNASLRGHIDLQRQKMHMTLALPGTTLGKMFKQCRSLSEDFSLEIPLQCSLSAKALEKKLFWYFVKNYAMLTSEQR